MKVVQREGVFIPIKDITPKIKTAIEDKMHFAFYEERSCSTCDNKNERHNDLCDNCTAFKGSYRLASVQKVKGKSYLKVPIGGFETKIRPYLEYMGKEVKVAHKGVEPPVRPFKFTGTLKPEQELAVQALMKKRRGVLKAPPRSGKTVLSTALACQLSVKTLIIASQRDWLAGFYETFVGSDTQKPLTNLKKQRIGFCKKLEDFEKFDVCLATVQTFYSEGGEALLLKIRSMFGLIIADEIHTGAADKYIKILSKLNCRRIVGLSGTPSRKDDKFVLVDNVVGPLAHEVIVKGMQPQLLLTKTGYTKSYKGNVPWTRMVKSIETDKKRLDVIATTAVSDVAKGHMILIPMAGVEAVNTLVKLINEKAGKDIAVAFLGGMGKKREAIIQDAREYKIKVIVGTGKILSTGINIPRASCLFEVIMSSNKENAEQRMRRVLTPIENKPQPVIRYFLDDMNVRKNCMRNEYFNVMLPIIKPHVSDEVKKQLTSYFNSKSKPFEL